MKDNYGDLPEPHMISNTQIVAMINKLYPRLHKQSKNNKQRKKSSKNKQSNKQNNKHRKTNSKNNKQRTIASKKSSK